MNTHAITKLIADLNQTFGHELSMTQKTELTLLYSLRATLHEMEVALGLSDMTELERTILEYIAFCQKNERKVVSSELEDQELFKDISRASIFRALKSLKSKNKIYQEADTVDRRVKYLYPSTEYAN